MLKEECYRTSETGTGEVSADDGDGFADSARALGFVEAVFAFGEGCVEECEAWGFGLGDGWDGSVLGAAEEGERGEGQEVLDIHGQWSREVLRDCDVLV
jgi:hypothetical protein